MFSMPVKVNFDGGECCWEEEEEEEEELCCGRENSCSGEKALMCFLGLVSGAAARGEKRTWSQWCHTRSARSSLPINFRI